MAAQLAADVGELTAAVPIPNAGSNQATPSFFSLRTLPDSLPISGHRCSSPNFVASHTMRGSSRKLPDP